MQNVAAAVRRSDRLPGLFGLPGARVVVATSFYLGLPLLPIGAVCYGTGRARVTEVIGWVVLVFFLFLVRFP